MHGLHKVLFVGERSIRSLRFTQLLLRRLGKVWLPGDDNSAPINTNIDMTEMKINENVMNEMNKIN